MSDKIDARGLACPAPVLQTKQMIEKEAPQTIQVLVDNEAAKQNVTRFLESQYYGVEVAQDGEDYWIIGKQVGQGAPQNTSAENIRIEQKKIMVMVTGDRIGHGDDELGAKLIAAFLKTLEEMGKDLWRLVFLNNGVKLTIQDSTVLPTLKALEEDGVHILVCGTCLDHFNLLEKKQVGETTNMLDIVTSMQLAESVINI